MSDTGLAIAHVLLLWWFGTGAVLFLDGLPRRTFPWTLAGATALAGAALAALAYTSDHGSIGAAHVAFASAVVVWGWNEILFLTGTVTGPRRTRCPEGARGWPRFRFAAESVLWHELVLVGSAAAIAAVTAGGDNPVGLLAFLTLWAMRLSAKLNIFLGVRNLGEELLPDHLRYLASYFRHAPMNPLFPASVAAGSALFVAFAAGAFGVAGAPGAAVGATILATLTALALAEHWMLVLPLDTARLWRWGMKSRPGAPAGDLPARSTAAARRARR